MAGFSPVLHDFETEQRNKTWMTGTRPVMTTVAELKQKSEPKRVMAGFSPAIHDRGMTATPTDVKFTPMCRTDPPSRDSTGGSGAPSMPAASA